MKSQTHAAEARSALRDLEGCTRKMDAFSSLVGTKKHTMELNQRGREAQKRADEVIAVLRRSEKALKRATLEEGYKRANYELFRADVLRSVAAYSAANAKVVQLFARKLKKAGISGNKSSDELLARYTADPSFLGRHRDDDDDAKRGDAAERPGTSALSTYKLENSEGHAMAFYVNFKGLWRSTFKTTTRPSRRRRSKEERRIRRATRTAAEDSSEDVVEDSDDEEDEDDEDDGQGEITPAVLFETPEKKKKSKSSRRARQLCRRRSDKVGDAVRQAMTQAVAGNDERSKQKCYFCNDDSICGIL